MKLVKTLALSTILAGYLLANETLIHSIGVNLGVSATPYEQTNHNGSITLGSIPDETFTSYEVYTTFNPLSSLCKEMNMKPTVSYSYSVNSHLKHQYILAGFNKYYRNNSYAGILLGYGELKYKYNPLNNSKNNDYATTSAVIGIQTGYDYPLSSSLSLGVNLKALYHNYDAFLNPNNTATANLEHDYTLKVSVGIGWRF